MLTNLVNSSSWYILETVYLDVIDNQSVENMKWPVTFLENSRNLSLGMQLTTYLCVMSYELYIFVLFWFSCIWCVWWLCNFNVNESLESRFELLLLLGGSRDELDIPKDLVRPTSWNLVVCLHKYHVNGRCCCIESYRSLWLPSGELTSILIDSCNYMCLLLIFIGEFFFFSV